MKEPTVILPRHPSITSAYVADTMESDEDLNEYSLTCEQSLTWRGKDTRARIWLQKVKKNKWMQLLFSRTLRPSHTTSFVDAWTSYLRASHANPFPAQVNDNQPKTQDTCTRGLQMELPLADHDSSSSKTSKESSQPRQETVSRYCFMSLKTWKQEVTSVRGEYLVRVKSALHTNAKESSSWGTPQASDHVEGARTRVDSNQKCLGRDLNRMKMFPTIRAQEPARTTKGYGRGLAELVEGKKQIDPDSPPVPTNDNTSGKNRELSWPTPKTNNDRMDSGTFGKPKEQSGNLGTFVNYLDPKNPTKERLNPNWVEQLMGLPVGWTRLPYELIG